VLILRQIDGNHAVAQFDIANIRSGHAKDPVIQAGDIVVAPTSFMKETFNNILKASPVTSVFRALQPFSRTAHPKHCCPILARLRNRSGFTTQGRPRRS
jgi:hypothetical protein